MIFFLMHDSTLLQVRNSAANDHGAVMGSSSMWNIIFSRPLNFRLLLVSLQETVSSGWQLKIYNIKKNPCDIL